jgi:hypothetical protein
MVYFGLFFLVLGVEECFEVIDIETAHSNFFFGIADVSCQSQSL